MNFIKDLDSLINVNVLSQINQYVNEDFIKENQNIYGRAGEHKGYFDFDPRSKDKNPP
nr:hypothetical protein [Campylobacter jejuni]